MNKSLMKNALLVPVIVSLVLGSGAGFVGGMKYQQSKSPVGGQRQFGAGAGQGGNRINRGNMPGFNGTVGEILSKNDTSVTLKLRDGGSRILFFSDKAEITKSVAGTTADLEVGKSVMARGTSNPDGSVTAQSIQIVTALPPGPGANVPAPTK